MRYLPPSLAPSGYSPARHNPLSPAPVSDQGQRLTGIQAIQRLFASGENGGYWPADPAYLYEDSAGTIPASLNGVCGLWMDHSQGGVAQARRNVLTYSDQFDNAVWVKRNTTITANAITAPDGTLTADFMLSTTPDNRAEQTITTPVSGIYVASCYVKKGTSNDFTIRYYNLAADNFAKFNLTNGTLTSNTNGSALSSITPVGGGWFLCSTSTNTSISAGSSSIVAMYNQTNTGNTSSYIWGAQFETGASATPYQKIITGTADLLPGNHALQQTTANKPYLRRTPVSSKYWLDSNTATGALTATFASSLGSACTIATVGAEGVTILENQTIETTYNVAPAYGYNGDVLIINRALTAVEKALVTRHFKRGIPTISNGAII